MQQIPRPEHPNPQWERKNWVNLNGTWQFEIDNGTSGEARGLPKAESLYGQITVPFCPESSLSGIGNKDFMLRVWYKKKVTFREQDLNGNRVILHFGAADFLTKLWVNGTQIGLPHVGGYGSFEYDVTDALTVGENTITVSCYDDTRAPRQAGGKQSPQYDSFRCYYTRTTGIWQTVWYEIVPENYIKYARLTPDAANGTVSIFAELCGTGDLSAEVYFEGKKMGAAAKKNRRVNGTLEIELAEKHLWELGNGRLYDVVLRFGKDEVKTYFGLRDIAMDGAKFLLNGKSVFQRLVLDQGFYHDGICTAPSDEALMRDIQLSMAAGFNGARLHQKVFEPRFLYHADRLGYMVWGEYGNWGIDHSDIANLSTFLPDWLSSVKRDCSHPSIVGWCPFNETWDYGPQCKRQDNEFLRIVYEQTKQLDPTRPCIDTSGNYHVVTDIYDIHDYDQNVETFKARFDEACKSGTIAERVGPDRQKWDGKQPLFVSEYGGIGFMLLNNDFETGRRKTDWSYGKTTTSFEEFYARYEGLTHALLDNPLMMGFCYTQLTDVEQEKNGFFEYETRKPKFDLDILSKINKKKAAIED